MNNNNNNSAAMEFVCKSANSVFPELNVRPNDISHPSEAFLTRLLTHFLRAFGFRVDPPYNIDNESADMSKEKRAFLGKLSRQVEAIVQISFPEKIFCVIDIIQPMGRKTLNILDILFNYLFFYKMHRKEVINPIMAALNERQALIASNAAKRRELEQRKKEAAQEKVDRKQCEENINKLSEDLPRAKAKLNEQTELTRHLEADLAKKDDHLSEISSQVKHLKQLVVLDSEVAEVREQTKRLAAQIESYKPVIAQQEQIFQERRLDIEGIIKLKDEIEKAMNVLPAEKLSEFKENLKLKERLEKNHATLLSKHQSLQSTKEKNKQILVATVIQLKTHKLKFNQKLQLEQETIEAEKSLYEQRIAQIEELEHNNKTLQNKLDEEINMAKEIKYCISKILNEDEVKY